MACRNSYMKKTRRIMTQFFEGNGAVATVGEQAVSDLIFGVDSASPANVMLQNNLSMLEWVTRNKVYPVFWGRNLNGDGCLTALLHFVSSIYFLLRQNARKKSPASFFGNRAFTIYKLFVNSWGRKNLTES